MIYTIGNCKNYDKMLGEGTLYKAIKGTVWKDFSDVLNYFKTAQVELDEKIVDAAIYVVDGDWDTDVINKENGLGVLNKNCKIVRKI